MKKSTYTLLSLLLLVGMYCAASVSYALDAPHNPVDGVDCALCHYPAGTTPAWTTVPTTSESTPLNALCGTCHYDTNYVIDEKFRQVKTHSSFETDPTATGSNIYLIECRACHNPHLQDQMRALPADGNLDFGTTTSITASALTDTTKSWGLNQFKDAVLIPNTAYIAYSYRITGNTANTLNIAGAMKTMVPYTGVGKPYRIKYGKLIRNSVVLPSGATQPVTFLSNSGPNSFATSTTAITGICQVCHTKTTSFNNTGTLAGPLHVQNAAGTNCTACHLHKDGFKGGGCNGCHGSSGTSGAPLNSGDLLTTPYPPTGHDEGKHAKHVVDLNQGCQVCHAGNTMPTMDSEITMSFSGAATGGSYQGTTLNAPYTYSAGVTMGATQQCSNIACHSTVQGANGTGAPTYANPQWTVGTPALTCASCHTDMSLASGTGSHPRHVISANTPCAGCHTGYTAGTTNGAVHANGTIDVAPGTGSYSGGTIPGDNAPGGGYGTCSTTYCHGTPASPVWGNAGTTCVSCHDATSALALGHGKHYNSTVAPTVLAGGTDKHSATAYVYSCLACHPSNLHANGPADASVPQQDANVGGAGMKITAYVKGASPTVDGKGFNATNGTCTTLCHTRDGVTPGSAVVAQNWGTTATGACGVCHNQKGDASPVWTAPHNKHITSYPNFSCASCHVDTASSNTSLQTTTTARTQHPNGNRDLAMNGFATGSVVAISGGQGSQQCSNTYCHSNGTVAAGTHTAIPWTGSTTCGSCHAATPTSFAHTAHMAVGTITCNNCHAATATTLNTISSYTNHVDKQVTINFSAASSGATATYNGVTAGGASVYQKPVAGVTTGGTCNTTNCHGSNSQNWTATNVGVSTCVKCHGIASSPTASYTVNNDIAAPGYNGTGVNTAGVVGTIVGGVSQDKKVGAHDTHLRGVGGYKGASGIACNDCHAVTAIGDAGHMDGSTTFTWGALATTSGATPTYSTATGACATNYCHGGAFGAGVIGTDPTPTWTDGTYLANPASAMNSVDCNKCHLSPPTSTVKYNHSAVTFGPGACNSCHQHDGSGSSHMDGILYGVGMCNSCHDYDVDAITGDWGKSPKAVEGWGAHATHINHLKSLTTYTLNPSADAFGGPAYNAICGVCHTRTTSLHSMSSTTNVRSINFGDAVASSPYSFGTGTPLYNGLTGTSSASTAKTCSNVSCHFQASPVWQGL